MVGRCRTGWRTAVELASAGKCREGGRCSGCRGRDGMAEGKEEGGVSAMRYGGAQKGYMKGR